MKKQLVVVVLLLGLLSFSGCAHISGGVAPSTIPLTPGTYHTVRNVRGTDCVYYLFCGIPLRGGNETKNAVEDALSRAPGANALINVTADTYSHYYIVFCKTCTQVYGTAVAPNK